LEDLLSSDTTYRTGNDIGYPLYKKSYVLYLHIWVTNSLTDLGYTSARKRTSHKNRNKIQPN